MKKYHDATIKYRYIFLAGSSEGGATTMALLWLASVFVVAVKWSTNLNIIFIISGVRCPAMVEDK